jgi:2-dehydro-3-deoxyphosphogalactonate aldolase
MTLEDALSECPVVAIVRGIRPDEAHAHVEALYAAGIRGVEVPLNSPSPLDSIRHLAEAWAGRMIVGAGTVLDAESVEAVAEVGGKLIVAPNTNAAVIRRAVALGLAPAPGFGTATEAFTALEAGARHLKLFPAISYGPGYVKQLKAVLPDSAVIWAVGGAGADNMAAWWAAGARGFGLGGELYKPGQSVADTAAKAARVVAVARTLC